MNVYIKRLEWIVMLALGAIGLIVLFTVFLSGCDEQINVDVPGSGCFDTVIEVEIATGIVGHDTLSVSMPIRIMQTGQGCPPPPVLDKTTKVAAGSMNVAITVSSQEHVAAGFEE